MRISELRRIIREESQPPAAYSGMRMKPVGLTDQQKELITRSFQGIASTAKNVAAYFGGYKDTLVGNNDDLLKSLAAHSRDVRGWGPVLVKNHPKLSKDVEEVQQLLAEAARLLKIPFGGVFGGNVKKVQNVHRRLVQIYKESIQEALYSDAI